MKKTPLAPTEAVSDEFGYDEVADKGWLRSLTAEELLQELDRRTMAARRALAVHIENLWAQTNLDT